MCGTCAAQDNRPNIARQSVSTTGAIEGLFQNEQRQGLGNVAITIRSVETNQSILIPTEGDGVFRVLNLRPGRFVVRAELEGYRIYQSDEIAVKAGELVNMEVTLMSTASPSPLRQTFPDLPPQPVYRTLPMPQSPGPETTVPPVPEEQRVYAPFPNRWKFDWPDYHRYGPKDEVPYIKGRTIDPFNRSKLKGDYPIFGRAFLVINLTSDTFNEGRQIPVGAGIDRSAPGINFFGRFGQYAFVQDFGFSVTLFHGDTSFKPVDWQIKFTPEINVNYIDTQENGVVNANPAKGTTRLDSHVGLQEAFVEAKIHDLSDNYDFISARLGIQTFNSDFRGFIFFDQEPGARLFGNLGSNRWQYNAAYFAMLEKDSNSGLNTFNYRHQQVMVANLFRQDFFKPGYTIQASYHFDKDDPSLLYNTDQFLVRPSPVGAVFSQGKIQENAIRAHYIGLTGDGHIGRLNVDHAFYQVLGRDHNNVIANALNPTFKTRNINAQMGALELSEDRDWIRYRVSAFYASGSPRPGSKVERGFDSILDNPNFAGGFFSFWIREGIRLTSTGVGLTQGNSLVPDLRSSKTEGQANFVNPGIFIYNAASDVKLTQKLRLVFNANFIRFARTESLSDVLFQQAIHKGVGADTGLGVVYRPFLSDNIIFTGVFNAFVPWQGFRDIYTGQTLYAVALNVRFRF